MEDIEYQKKQVDTYKMFLKIREEQAKKEKYKNYSQDGLINELLEKQEENERLEEDLEYSNHCNEELRKKISNLNYKIKLLEEDNNDVNVANTIIFELQDRIDKAIEYINYAIESDDIEELRSARHLLLFNEDLDKLLNILKGSDK